MIQLKINGKTVQAEEGQTILDVARRENFVIPTLCFHDMLGSSGRCKLCVVQVRQGENEKIISSCLYKARDGMEVFTDSPQVREVRKKNLSDLIAKAPSADRLYYLAARYDVPIPEYSHDQAENKCILCTMCVRTCKKIAAVSALSVSRQIQVSDACIGCGACVAVCPTGHITMTEKSGTRTVWGKDFELAVCPRCGRSQAPLVQLKWISEKVQVPLDELMICPDCR